MWITWPFNGAVYSKEADCPKPAYNIGNQDPSVLKLQGQNLVPDPTLVSQVNARRAAEAQLQADKRAASDALKIANVDALDLTGVKNLLKQMITLLIK